MTYHVLSLRYYLLLHIPSFIALSLNSTVYHLPLSSPALLDFQLVTFYL